MKYRSTFSIALLMLNSAVFAMEKADALNQASSSSVIQESRLSAEFFAELNSEDIPEDEIRQLEEELLVDGHKLSSRAARYQFFKERNIPRMSIIIDHDDEFSKFPWIALLSEYEIVLYSKSLEESLKNDYGSFSFKFSTIFDLIYNDTLKIFAEDALYRGVFPTVPYGADPVQYYRDQWRNNNVIGAVINPELLIITHSLCRRLLELGQKIPEFKDRMHDFNKKCRKVEYMIDRYTSRFVAFNKDSEEQFQYIFQLYDESITKPIKMSIVKPGTGNLIFAGDSDSWAEETIFETWTQKQVAQKVKKLILFPRINPSHYKGEFKFLDWLIHKFELHYPFKVFPYPLNKYQLLWIFVMYKNSDDKRIGDFSSLAEYLAYLENEDTNDPNSPFLNFNDVERIIDRIKDIKEQDEEETLKKYAEKARRFSERNPIPEFFAAEAKTASDRQNDQVEAILKASGMHIFHTEYLPLAKKELDYLEYAHNIIPTILSSEFLRENGMDTRFRARCPQCGRTIGASKG